MQYAAVSDIGKRRTNNQDAHAEVIASDSGAWYARGHVFVVADGMGAHAAGELASKMAADAVPHLYHKYHELPPPEAIRAALQEANAQIHGRGEANAEFRNMGTTCSVLLLLPQGALVAHVGDSRVYRVRGQRVDQLTFDHSLVWEMRAAGQLPEDEDQTFGIPKNVITRSLGPHPAVQVDLEGPFPVEVGDVFLLCSDGLTGPVRDRELGTVLAHLEPREAAQMLVDLANLRGGPDNITAIVLKVTDSELTTRHARAEPLTYGGQHHVERNVHPAVWVVMGVFFLGAAALALTGNAIAAVVSLVGGVIALAIVILQKFGPPLRSGVTLASGRRLGHGPHQRVDLANDGELVECLLAEWHQGRQQAAEQNAAIDWSDFDAKQAEVIELLRRDECGPALRRLAEAGRLLAQRTRSHLGAWSRDSYYDR